MAIGDPWDTTYNPRYSTPLRNQRTGQQAWMPDASDEVSQNDPLALKDRRKGRFCTEGCGCIDTYCSNLAGHKCTLPPELAITIFRTPDGRYQARKGLESGEGETYHLKYANGSWRGSRCCSHNADGSLDYACDPCKVSTLPNGKPSECHYANNKYKELDGNHQVGDSFTPRDKYDYDNALTGDVWPRRGVDTWLVPEGYNETLPTDGTEMLRSSERTGSRYTACFNEDGVLQESSTAIRDDPSCKAEHGPKAYWNQYTPSWTNNDVTDKEPVEDLIGTELEDTQFSVTSETARLNIKAVEKRINLDEENYLVGYKIQNGTDEDVAENVADPYIDYPLTDSREGGCIEDGAVPIKKRPWCRNSGTGARIRQQCTDTQYKNKEDCEEAVVSGTDETTVSSDTWLNDDKSECEGTGSCYPPEEEGVVGVADLSKSPLSPYCAAKGYCSKDKEGIKPQNKSECDAIDGGEWSKEEKYDAGYCVDEIGQRVPLNVPAGMTEQECKDSDTETWVEPSESKKGCEDVSTEDVPGGTEWTLGDKGSCQARYKDQTAVCANSDGGHAAGECSLDPDNNKNKTQEGCIESACYLDETRKNLSEGECDLAQEAYPNRQYSWKKGLWASYDKEDICDAAGGTWLRNIWIPNDWVDWEYEKRSCCGGTILDESHPFHTPQISGTARNTRKNTVCFTPYSEVILHTDAITGFIGDSRGEGCTSIGNQFDRQLFFPDIESYWTVVIRPCNFWGSCMEEGKKRPDAHKLTGQPDNYFDTTCGEEIVLYLPVDQFLNCSNFNLTLENERQLRSGWKESQPMWDFRMGAYEYGNPATELAAKVGMSSAVTGAGNISGGFPGEPGMYGMSGDEGSMGLSGVYSDWCMDEDVSFDGIADGSSGGDDGALPGHAYCNQYVYYSSGVEFNRLANAKGAEAFHGFNIQPQPFKASEEKQNRAKTFEQALYDKKYWQGCVGHILGDMGGGGHWFWNYGADYFMYYDFVAWDEVYPGIKPGGHCERIAQKALDYVNSQVGFLRHGDCGYGNGALWVGWVPYDASVNDPSCPDCSPVGKDSCGSTNTCILPDGTFEHGDCDGKGQCIDWVSGGAVEGVTTEEDCKQIPMGQWEEGKTKACCEWDEGCSEQICTNFEKVVYGTESCIYRDATNKAECECEASDTCAGGEWHEHCAITPARLLNEECSIVEDIPEGLINIVLGEKVGSCTCRDEDGVDIGGTMTESECSALVNSGKCAKVEAYPFTAGVVGGIGGVTYPVRENEVVKLRVDGPLTTELTDLSEIEDGFRKSHCLQDGWPFFDEFLLDATDDKTICLALNGILPGVFTWGPDYYTTQFGLRRRNHLPAGDGVGNSMTYWHNTGLFPKGEMVSYVNDHCVGMVQNRRIQYASNEKPIKITSRNHLLRDGDVVATYDVAGNFGANTMTNREWQETQWEDKIYSPCTGDSCDEVIWPDSVCPKDNKCLDIDGNEIPNKDRRGCIEGTCKDKREDGSECTSSQACKAPKEECIRPKDDGTCKEGFKKDRDWKFDNETGKQPECDPDFDSCCKDENGNGWCLNKLWDRKGDPMGCASTWDGKAGNTFESYCDYDKYYACEGERVLGKDPPPMWAFVAKNVTLDTFDLYTCDKHPVDGRIQNKTNLDTAECPDESKMVCVKNDQPYQEIVTEPKHSVKITDPKSEKYFGLAAIVPFEKKEWCEDPDGRVLDKVKTKALCLSYNIFVKNRWLDNYSLEQGNCNIDTANNKTQSDCIQTACYANDVKTKLKEADCTGSNEDGAPLLWTNGIWSGGDDADTRCLKFGACKIVFNYEGMEESMMTRDECVLLAKTFRELQTVEGGTGQRKEIAYTSGRQIYVNQCYDVKHHRDNHESIIKNATDFNKVEKQCLARNHKCADFEGNDMGGDNEDQCSQMGGEWEVGYAKKQYSECVDAEALKNGDETKAFKACWVENKWMSSNMVDTVFEMSSKGLPSVGVWKACPFTGQWDYWGNSDDAGVEAGYVSHLHQDEMDSKYRFGWGGPGYKWEERANDYYVQIEQKGICPVCCDHFMPRSLVATIIDQPTAILDHIECKMDPCNAPTADDSFTINDVTGAALHDGYCCADAHHSCHLGYDVEACEAEFLNPASGKCTLTATGETVNVSEQDCLGPVYRWKGSINFGYCHRDGELLVAYTQDPCVDDRKGVFTPLTAAQDCDLFIRTRLNNEGTTNCRKCSEVYSSRHKILTHAETGNIKSREFGLLDYAGNNCCEESTLCERTVNEQDWNTYELCSYDYPTCDDVRSCCGPCLVEGKTCTAGNVSAVCKVLIDEGGDKVGIDWHFEPCACFPNKVPYEYEPDFVHNDPSPGSCDWNGFKNKAGEWGVDNRGGCTDVDGNIVAGKERKNGTLESDCDLDDDGNPLWKSGGGGCGPIHIKTDADQSCYDLGNSVKPYDSTCPGLGTLDVPLEYDGAVWRSEWTLMNEVGLKQCEIVDGGFGVQRFHWPVNCRAKGPTQLSGGNPGVGAFPYIAPTEIVAVGGDCAGCDMPQMGMHGILKDGIHSLLQHRNPLPPNKINDGHFIRLVMGCGNSIPSIDAYRSGDIVDGGFGPQGGIDYRVNGIQVWSEITNCTFTDFLGSEGLRVDRVDTGVSGSHPCFPGLPCISKRQLVKLMHGDDAEVSIMSGGSANAPTLTERVFNFSGRCVRKKGCGPKGPCHGTECCVYMGRDVPLARGAPVWNRSVACSQGGDIAHRCNTTSFDPLPSKPAEQFTVHYIKDVDPVTGEGTLVVPAYAPTFGGMRCGYESGTPIGIGLANLQDAEFDTFGDFSRNNKSRNPYLPAGGTILTGARTSAKTASGVTYKNHDGIPYGNDTNVDGDMGRGDGQFMEIKVANIAPLITKNPRKNRHLRIYDRSRGSAESGFHNAATLSGMNMLQRYDLPQPYGLKPWPVDHQTHSTAYSPWPKGGPHSPNALLGGIPTESLRKDPALSLNQPGRVGPMPTMDNLNRMFRFTEEAMGEGMTTPMPEIWPYEPVQIDRFDNIYSDSLGTCINSYYEEKDECESADYLWIPQFLYTKVTTKYDHDLADAEKLVISGSVTYPATCKGARMGHCVGVVGADINECMEGECTDTETINSPWVLDDLGDLITNESDCASASQRKADAAFGESGDTSNIKPLVFKSAGQWIQVFDDPGGDDGGGSSTFGSGTEDVLGNADRYICEVMFGGEWVVGKANNDTDKKGFYKDPKNEKPYKLTLGHEGFVQGCPVGCRLNGFYLTDPCSPPSDDSPKGQCFECVETIVVKEGKEIREMRCPLGPVDGNYVARKRGCQHAEYVNQKDCEEQGWAWFGEITAANEFAIHQEMELTIHDASQLRSNLESLKPNPTHSYATDWEYDLSSTPKRITTDAGFTGKSDPLSSLEEDACNATRGAAWAGRCVDLSRLDAEFPDSFGDDPESAEAEEKEAMYDLCSRSDNCQFIQNYKTCLGTYWSDAGKCYRGETDENGDHISEETTKKECDALSGVFVGEPIEGIKNADECAELSLGGTCHLEGGVESKISEGECREMEGSWKTNRTGTAIYDFECVDAVPSGSYTTPKECTEIGLGKVAYKGTPQSISLDENKMNVVTMMDKLSKLSSPEAIAMGHDVGIGLSPRNHKGVIYSPQVDVSIAENKGYDKYADPNWRAVWSRHGGAFDIIIGYPPPENNCRQGNSDKPTNMDFYLDFEQICCNDKGPLNFHKCEDKCWHHYYGPILNDMELVHGTPGNSILHVNIHESEEE